MAISDIDEATPSDSDGAGGGAAQIRTFKSDVKNTWPGLDREPKAGTDGATITPELLEGLFDSVDGVTADEGVFIKGMIMLWNGSAASIPSGWTLCNGVGVNGVAVPDLQDLFVIGAGDSYNPNTQGGSLTTSSAGAHNHGGSTGGHALTVAQLPDIEGNLELAIDESGQADSHEQTGYVARGRTGDTPSDYTAPISTSGMNGATHSHSVSSDGSHGHTMPLQPYYALCYICYVAA